MDMDTMVAPAADRPAMDREPRTETAPRVLISDELSERAVEVMRERGLDVDFRPELGRDKERLIEAIGGYDGLAVRSATKVSEKVIAAAKRLKVIGRAGIGVDNIDLPAATARGIIVMNTPYGNSITTAEHAIAMLLASARHIPAADASTQGGQWEKSRFTGVEITGKVLGIIGCGNIGSVVAARARGLAMRVIAYDPYLSQDRAVELGVEKVDLDNLLRRADFISLHTPLTDKTRNIIDEAAIAKMKPGARLINCARGGLVDEAALRRALDSGRVAGAAIDVFSEEPARSNVLFGAPNVVCTPHLGAATTEAQENVAIQIAEQMADYLTTGAVQNALNMPSISAEEAPRLMPLVRLAEQLGSFAGQLTESAVRQVRLEYEGTVAELNTGALTAAALAGFLQPVLETVNMVSAPAHAKERGIAVEEVRRDQSGAYEGYMRLTVVTDRQERSVAGTVFADGKPRIIQIKGINMEAELGRHMLYITNQDKPGFIGRLGTILGEAGVNIATFNLGRSGPGGDAIALLEVDEPVDQAVLEEVRAIPNVIQVKPLAF
jgi:D-3-phosphoglycerate dehydrogenase / 2-oxoglutarate reductase